MPVCCWGAAELSNPKCAASEQFGQVSFAGEEDGSLWTSFGCLEDFVQSPFTLKTPRLGCWSCSGQAMEQRPEPQLRVVPGAFWKKPGGLWCVSCTPGRSVGCWGRAGVRDGEVEGWGSAGWQSLAAPCWKSHSIPPGCRCPPCWGGTQRCCGRAVGMAVSLCLFFQIPLCPRVSHPSPSFVTVEYNPEKIDLPAALRNALQRPAGSIQLHGQYPKYPKLPGPPEAARSNRASPVWPFLWGFQYLSLE